LQRRSKRKDLFPASRFIMPDHQASPAERNLSAPKKSPYSLPAIAATGRSEIAAVKFLDPLIFPWRSGSIYAFLFEIGRFLLQFQPCRRLWRFCPLTLIQIFVLLLCRLAVKTTPLDRLHRRVGRDIMGAMAGGFFASVQKKISHCFLAFNWIFLFIVAVPVLETS
jgi:hypothetical protein